MKAIPVKELNALNECIAEIESTFDYMHRTTVSINKSMFADSALTAAETDAVIKRLKEKIKALKAKARCAISDKRLKQMLKEYGNKISIKDRIAQKVIHKGIKNATIGAW